MSQLYTRTVAWVLMSIAATLVAWGLELQDANTAAAQANQSLQAQLTRLKRNSTASVIAQTEPVEQIAVKAAAWRAAAKSYGSDARNTAMVLERVKDLCAKSGLKECQIKRSSVRTSGIVQAAGVAGKEAGKGTEASRLVPHAVNVLARFDAAGVEAFAAALLDSGLLFRFERVNIVQNRAEWDVVFFVLAGDGGAQ
ncbi:MAG: hypothetical protein H7293_07865 [Candidatus Saccharibacteria bacterium]|nr:hypothetical protein [Rhodoferax sp.]